jgi:hypothetical protein
MQRSKTGDLLVALVAWGTILFSLQALIYYIRWLIPLFMGRPSLVAPTIGSPQLWFFAKIGTNAIFLWIGVLLQRLHKKCRKTGYFEKDSLRLLKHVVIGCLSLAVLGVVQTICENADELYTDQWTSLWGVSNRLLRFFTHQIVFRERVIIYLLLAAILWGIRQFINQALNVKKENELFI